MRTSKKKLVDAPEAPEVSSQRSFHEEQDPPRPGDVVMLPDGALAAVERIVGPDAYVVEWQKQLGRGPWIFPVADLVRVS